MNCKKSNLKRKSDILGIKRYKLVLPLMLSGIFFFIRLENTRGQSTNETISAGSFIIDMGVSPKRMLMV